MCWYLKYISHKQHIVRSCFLIQSDLISIVDMNGFKSIILLFFLVVPSVLCFSFSYFLPSFFIVFFFKEFVLSPLLVAFALNKQLSFKELKNKKTPFIFTYICVFHSFVSRSASDRFSKHLYLKILFIWYHSVECFWI